MITYTSIEESQVPKRFTAMQYVFETVIQNMEKERRFEKEEVCSAASRERYLW